MVRPDPPLPPILPVPPVPAVEFVEAPPPPHPPERPFGSLNPPPPPPPDAVIDNPVPMKVVSPPDVPLKEETLLPVVFRAFQSSKDNKKDSKSSTKKKK